MDIKRDFGLIAVLSIAISLANLIWNVALEQYE